MMTLIFTGVRYSWSQRGSLARAVLWRELPKLLQMFQFMVPHGKTDAYKGPPKVQNMHTGIEYYPQVVYRCIDEYAGWLPLFN